MRGSTGPGPRAIIDLPEDTAPSLFGEPLAHAFARRLEVLGWQLVDLPKLPPDGFVLIVGEPLLPDQRLLDDFKAMRQPAILTVPNAPGFEQFELIDARTRWAGYALVPVDWVRQVAGELDDWRLASTVLRIALQGQARRLAVPQGRALRLTRPEDAERVERLILSGPGKGGAGTRLVLAPLARALLSPVLRASHGPGWLTAAFPALLLTTIALLFFEQWGAASLVLLAAGVTAEAGSRLAEARGRSFVSHGRLAMVLLAAVALGGATMEGWDATGQWGVPVLAVGICSLLTLVEIRARRDAAVESWRPDLPALLLLLGIASLLGMFVAGLALAILHLAAAFVVLERRLLSASLATS